MVHVNTVHQSDPIIGVGTASLTDPVFHLKKGLKGEKESLCLSKGKSRIQV